jgi:hypothetical protein
VLHTDYTSLIITDPNSVEFSAKVNTVFSDINKWFMSNLMFLNFNGANFLLFWNQNSKKLDLNITSWNKHFTNTTNVKFLALIIDDETLS